MIDQPTIDRILDAANIVDVVSEFVTLRKRGINYVGLCPFHSDKSPSFYVSPAKNICCLLYTSDAADEPAYATLPNVVSGKIPFANSS